MVTSKWYTLKGQQMADALFGYVSTLRKEQAYRQDENYRHLRLYGNMEVFGLKTYSFYRSEPSSAVQNRVTLNIIQSMIDTVVSKLTKNKPRPLFLTDGGDWSLQQKAKKLTKFVEGQMYANKFYESRAMAIQDSCIFGTGALKFYRDEKDICIERVFIDELAVDEKESLYSTVRQLSQTKLIDKDVLKSMFPNKADKIEVFSANELSEYYSSTTSSKSTDNLVEVVEAWYLPTKKGAKDGKHVIVMDKVELFSEPYTKDCFPFVFWKWGVRPVGFWGQGIAEQLTGIQLEINKILRTIQVSMHLVSIPKIFVEASSKVVSSHLNNKIGGIIKYVGVPPQEGKLGTIPPDLFNHLDRLYGRAYEIVGVSQLAAQAAKPQGLNSGKALREFNDIESERFMSVAQRDEQCVLESAAQLIALAKEIHEEYGEYKVKIKNSYGMQVLDWSEVDMEEDQYIMQMYPVSSLSKTPAGRLQDIQELMSAGLIGPEDGKRLLDFPDLTEHFNFTNAPLDNIMRTIELMVDKGTYMSPEPYQNLELGITKMQEAYLYLQTCNAPESRLELIRRWIEDAQALMQKAQQEMMAQQQAMAAPPTEAMPPEQAPEPAIDQTLPIAE